MEIEDESCTDCGETISSDGFRCKACGAAFCGSCAADFEYQCSVCDPVLEQINHED